MNRDRILGYAVDLACFMGGTNYGHMGRDPRPPEELDANQAGYIQRLVSDGRRAAIAREQHDEARANLCRETVPKLRWIKAELGTSADELYDIGYRSVRNGGAQ